MPPRFTTKSSPIARRGKNNFRATRNSAKCSRSSATPTPRAIAKSAAIPVYIRSYQTATTDEVMNYSLFAASKLLQKQGEWDKVAELFSGFVKDKPDNPTRRFGALLDRQSESARRQDRRSQTTRRRHDQEIHRRSEARRGRAIDHAARAALREEKARCSRRALTPVSVAGTSARAGVNAPGYDRSGRGTRSPAFLDRPTKNPPPPKRASFSPRPSSPGSGVNRMKRKKTSRRSRVSLSRKT